MEECACKPKRKAVIKGVSYFLAHVPGMLRYGSKPSREISKTPSLWPTMLHHLWNFNRAVAYPPHQVFVGNLDPDELAKIPAPWYKNPLPGASRWGAFGEIMPEEEFYGLMKICDEFEIILLEKSFLEKIHLLLKEHPLVTARDLQKLGKGYPLEEVKNKVRNECALPLYAAGERLVGCLQRLQDDDPSLYADVLMENLAARASGVLALRHLIRQTADAREIDYLLGFGEEAVGDRYNRGGGNLAKAIGEKCGCLRATGSDVKAFCCAPVHALMLGASLIVSGLFKDVALVGGGSLAKLGMKFHGHLRHDMPILEDVLAAVAIRVGEDDGHSPVIRLDSLGKHEIGSGSSQQEILQKLVVEPLDRLGMKLTDVGKYATEMHNPEITEPQGSGDVPRTNYRTIAGLAVLRKEIERGDIERFVARHGLLGFSPTQGHIASAIPVLGHSVRKILSGEMENTLFLAKGSLFLGRMTQLADGISFLLEKNRGGI